ncbi:hypothetical protein M501DRAFT_1003917 [Patellaria atrata CBS 101060]|uniref:Amidohydrolase-related domain-containing protein n=1 Tax=Patellaria atrata CBS 101060 TaxID=1346257 RepID=A0A9P4VQ04_9PEZI|nr:hypothetical protein M501DRAFT_1003917 [Patellaria atrata CBS 101060]
MPNYQFPLLDSHIHLWPPEAADSRSHEWMVPGGPLTKEYSISHYVEASAPYFSTASEHYTPSSPSQSSATTERRSHASSSEDSFKGTFEQSQHPAHGFIYIETDRTRPDFTSIASDYIHALSELEFLRRIVEGRPSEEDTFLPHHRKLLKGIVAFAPMIEWKRLDAYLKKAEEVAGAETWALVRGFRFLLQEMNSDHEMIRSALRDAFWGSLQLLGKKGYSFDVGVDAKRAGVWQVEFAVEMVEKTWQGVPRRERTAFIFGKSRCA